MTHPTDFRALCAELIEAMTDDSLGCWARESDVIDRAQSALSAAPQQGAPNYLLLPENEEQAAGMVLFGMEWLKQHAPHRLRDVRQGEPQQGPPSDEQILACRSWSSHGPTFDSDLVDFGRQLLARYGAQAVPVAVAERLPGKGDCAPWPDDPGATPWCWAAKEIDGGWEWVHLSMLGLGTDTLGRVIAGGGWTHWAPHWALPLPEAQP